MKEMTLKEVAKRADCSVATVSKALKNSPEISEEVKTRILAIAKESGYLKKATAHKAVLGGMKIVLFNDPKGMFKEEYISLQAKAKKSGLTLLVSALSEVDAKELKTQLGAFGLLLVGRPKKESDPYLLWLEDLSELEDFLKAAALYRPTRPSRAGQNAGERSTKSKTTSRKTPEQQPEKPVEPQPEPQKKQEEIWLL